MYKFNLTGLKAAVVCASFIIFAFPVFISADTSLGSSGQSLGSLVGEPCLVPIFHTQFAFPPEGGKIIKTSTGSMYFVRTYLPDCAGAGNSGTVISTGNGVNTFPNNEVSTTSQINSAQTTTTTYRAPQTGCR